MRHLPFLMLPLILTAAALAGCSNPEKTGRYLIDPPDAGVRVANNLGTAELRDVSLPDYASAGEVSWQTPDGAVRSNPKTLWADKPQRAFTLSLARAISDMSGATVIAEPWPLAEQPRRRVEVRVERALAQANGIYRLSGRYYVSNDTPGGANQARSFDISVPLPIAERKDSSSLGMGSGKVAIGASAAPAIAAAQNRAITQLAGQIATLGGPGATVRTSAERSDSLFDLPPLEALPPLEPLPSDEAGS